MLTQSGHLLTLSTRQIWKRSAICCCVPSSFSYYNSVKINYSNSSGSGPKRPRLNDERFSPKEAIQDCIKQTQLETPFRHIRDAFFPLESQTALTTMRKLQGLLRKGKIVQVGSSIDKWMTLQGSGTMKVGRMDQWTKFNEKQAYIISFSKFMVNVIGFYIVLKIFPLLLMFWIIAFLYLLMS